MKTFVEYIEMAQDANVNKLMRTMCQFYALYGIHLKSGVFSEVSKFVVKFFRFTWLDFF